MIADFLVFYLFFVPMSSETCQGSFRYLLLQLICTHLFVGNMVLMAISTLIIMRMILTKQSWHSLFKSKWAGRKSRGLEGEWAGRKSRFTNKRAKRNAAYRSCHWCGNYDLSLLLTSSLCYFLMSVFMFISSLFP